VFVLLGSSRGHTVHVVTLGLNVMHNIVM
jgi:hypothetical protein